jgi:hypothetical protein
VQQLIKTLRQLPTDIDPQGDEPAAIVSLSDAGLVQAVAWAIASPKSSEGTSFTLHAPLELLARATLLQLCPPQARSVGRIRIASIAAHYSKGDEIDPPERTFPTLRLAKSALIAALREGDADTADAAVVALASRISAQEFCLLLSDEIAANLGAAAHAPLLLEALPGAAARYGNLSILLRAPIRALATDPGTRLTWIGEPQVLSGPEGLWEALAEPPHIASPSYAIAPTMLAVESDGFASRLLGRATQSAPEAVSQSLLRIAALSMIQDDPNQAPYGWTHCLTLPQGVMALAPYAEDIDRLARIGATFVLGFRSTLGKNRLDKSWKPTTSPDVSTLAARAAGSADAHLAKYTVACLAAAAADPAERQLFLAAANYLGEWWDAHPEATFEG